MGISTFFGSFAIGSNSSLSLFNLLSEDPEQMIVHPALAVLGTILIIALLVTSLYGIVILSCSIACSGAGVLAVIVLLGGSYLAVFLAVLGIYNLFKINKFRGYNYKSEAAQKALGILLSIALLILLLIVL